MADEKNQNAGQVTDSILGAISIMTQHAVQGLQFDRTEIAEIVDITNRANGDYVVYNGSAKYHAYSENTSYALGNKVYVTIPNNDTSLKKTIIRRYNLNDDNRGLNYISPLDRYDVLTDNILEDSDIVKNIYTYIDSDNQSVTYDNETGIGLLANCNKAAGEDEVREPKPQELVLYSIKYLTEEKRTEDEKTSDIESGNDLGAMKASYKYQGYQYMGLSVKFQTLLSALKPIVGNFGIKIKAKFQKPRENTNAGVIEEERTYVLDTKNMIGAVYNFMAFFEQQALFELPGIDFALTDLDIIFFQDGNFKSSANTYISTKNSFGEELLDNIFVKDISIRLGNEKDESGKIDQLYIYSPTGLTYDGMQLNPDNRKENIVLKWSHRDPDTITDEKPDGELVELKSVNNIPNDTDLTFKAKIWWLYETTRKWGEYTEELNSVNETQNEQLQAQKRLIEIVNKPGELSDDEKKAYNEAVKALKDAYQWTLGKEYIHDGNGNYSLKDAGLSTIKKNTTQLSKGKVDVTPISSDWVEGWLPIQQGDEDLTSKFDISFYPDQKVEYARVRCIVEYGPWIELEDDNGNLTGEETINRNSEYYTVLESNVLEFKNMSYIPDLTTWDASIGLSINLNDNSKGVYPLYNGNDGRILNQQAYEKRRIMEADIISSYSGKSYLNGQETLIWKLPRKDNSMIWITEDSLSMMNGKVIDGSSKIFDENNQYKSIIGDYDPDFIYLIYDHTHVERDDDGNILTDENGNALTNLYHKYTYDDSETIKVLENNIEQYISQLTPIINRIRVRSETYNFDDVINSFTENEEINLSINKIRTFFNIASDKAISDNDESIIKTLLQSIIDAKKDIIKINEKIQAIIDNGGDIQTIYNRVTYQIAEYYKPNLLNNTVYCYLIKNGVMVQSSITLEFKQHGTAGTDYTFALSLGPLVELKTDTVNEHELNEFVEVGPAAPAITVGEQHYRQILFNLYDANDESVTLTSEQKNGIIEKWLSGDPQGFYQGYNKFGGNFDYIVLTERLSDDDENAIHYTDIAIRVNSDVTSLDNIKGIILKATLSTKVVTSTYKDKAYPLEGISFVQYLPLSVRMDDKYFVSTSNTIYYDDNGGNPRYGNNEIILTVNGIEPYAMVTKTREVEVYIPTIQKDENGHDKVDDNGNLLLALDDDGNVIYTTETQQQSYQEKSRFYEIKLRRGFGSQGYIQNWGNDETEPENGLLLPIGGNGIITVPNNYNGLPALTTDYKLIPYPLYIEEATYVPLIIEGWYNNGEEPVFATPLLILQNTYQIPALNSWNGNLLIDEQNNRVMAATIAAGHKDVENRFTGVIMGDVESEQNTSPELVRTQTGLYGYHEGAQSFGFKEDGTAFIGKSGTGRIMFDGSSGVIESASRSKVGSGMRIDLDDGILDIENTGDLAEFDTSINKWIFSPAGNNEKTKIKLQAQNPYFEISVPKQRVTSNVDEFGNKILEIQSGARQSLIKIGNEDYFLQTANYDTVANTGLKIDLQNGTFDSRGRLKINGALESEIKFGDSSNYLKLGIDKNSFSYFDLYSTGISDTQRNALKARIEAGTQPGNTRTLAGGEGTLVDKYFYQPYKVSDDEQYAYVGATLDGEQIVPHSRRYPWFCDISWDWNEGGTIRIPRWVENGYWFWVYDTTSVGYKTLEEKDANCNKYNSNESDNIKDGIQWKDLRKNASVWQLHDIERVINYDFDVYINKLKQKPYNDSQSPLYEDKDENDKIMPKYWVLKWENKLYDPVNNHRYGSYNRLDYWFNYLIDKNMEGQNLIKKTKKTYNSETYKYHTENEYNELVKYNIPKIQDIWEQAQDTYIKTTVYKKYKTSKEKVNDLKIKAEEVIQYCVSRDIAEIVFGVKLVEKKTQKTVKTYWEYASIEDVRSQYAAYVSNENPSTEKIAICKQINNMIKYLKEIDPTKIISLEKLKKLWPTIQEIPLNVFNDLEIPSVNTQAAAANIDNVATLNDLMIILIQRYLSKQFSLNTTLLDKVQKEESNLEELKSKLLASKAHKTYLTAKVAYETSLQESEAKLAELNKEYNDLIEREDYKLYLEAGEKLQDIKREGERLIKEIQNLYNEYDMIVSYENNESNNNHSIRISNSRKKRIEIGDNFWVKDDGEVLLSSLTFKKDDGSTVSKIHPQWRGFVTDVTGNVELRTVGVTVDDVTCYVDVQDVYTTVTHNIKQRQKIESTTATIVPVTRSSQKLSVYDSVRAMDPTKEFTPDATWGWYEHTINFPISYTVNEWIDAGSTTTTVVTTVTRTAKGTGTGHTDVPVVTGINLNVSKIFMWALTNKDDVTRTYSIDAKKKNGSYAETTETPNSNPSWDNKEWDSDIDS